MLVKLMMGGRKGEQLFQCEHLTKTFPADLTGVEVELAPGGELLKLPDDGEVIYVMNDKGDTVDSIRWVPPVAAVPPSVATQPEVAPQEAGT